MRSKACRCADQGGRAARPTRDLHRAWPIRTDWAGRSLKQTPNKIASYVETVGAHLRRTADGSGKQACDPIRAAPRRAGEVMIEIISAKHPPHQLVLGAWAVNTVDKHLTAARKDFDMWRERRTATDYDKAAEAA